MRDVKRYDSMGFVDALGLYVRWSDYDALLVQRNSLVEFVTDYIAAEEAAAIQWEKDYPKFPWKEDHEAIKRLARARAALKGASFSETTKQNAPGVVS